LSHLLNTVNSNVTLPVMDRLH